MKHILFSKRILAFLLSIIFLLFLCGCEQREGGLSAESPPPGSSDGNTSPTPIEISPKPTEPIDPAALSAYKAVLQNKAEFVSTYDGKHMDIKGLIDLFYVRGAFSAAILRFSVDDLDNDSTPEVILWEQRNGDDYYGFEVLRYHSEEVYGYDLPYRGFMQLKADRTFTFSGGAMDSGFGTIKFTDQTYSIDKIAYSQSSYDFNNNLSVSFFINNKSATQDEFNSAIKKQDKKPDAVWYDFTDDNIETVFTNS